MKQLTLQIKPVGNHCNIACSYCYAKPFKSKKFQILDIKLLDKLIKESFEITNNIIITWHGGEPTLAGLSFFEEYLNIVKKYKKPGQYIVNMIQTNATLIDDKMAKFFKDNNFIVSVSLDGPKAIHNLNRYDYQYHGSFDDTMRGIGILRKYDINPPVIATVSKETCKYVEEVFDFFVNNGFKEIKMSPVYDSPTDSFSLSNDKWYQYLKATFYKWLELKDSSIKIREIDEILMYFANKDSSVCTASGNCINWISIDEVGNIYPCEYLRNTNSYGNIKNISLFDVFNSPQYIAFKEQVNYCPERCKKCELYKVCRNGCPATRINKGKMVYNGEYVYCDAKLSLYAEIEKLLFVKKK